MPMPSPIMETTLPKSDSSMQPITPSPAPESRAAKILREVFESGRPLTYVRTSEEIRAGRVLREVGLRLFAPAPVPVWTWSPVSYTHLRAHETDSYLVCRLLLEKKK